MAPPFLQNQTLCLLHNDKTIQPHWATGTLRPSSNQASAPLYAPFHMIGQRQSEMRLRSPYFALHLANVSCLTKTWVITKVVERLLWPSTAIPPPRSRIPKQPSERPSRQNTIWLSLTPVKSSRYTELMVGKFMVGPYAACQKSMNAQCPQSISFDEPWMPQSRIRGGFGLERAVISSDGDDN